MSAAQCLKRHEADGRSFSPAGFAISTLIIRKARQPVVFLSRRPYDEIISNNPGEHVRETSGRRDDHSRRNASWTVDSARLREELS